MRAFIKKLFFLCLLILPVTLFSHPHIFIDNSFTFVFNDAGLEGIKIHWIFDEMFSASIIMDYDANRNRIFEEMEMKALELGAFSNLRNYNYFLHIDIGGVKLAIKKVDGFKAEIVDNRVAYHFFIPLNLVAESGDTLIKAGCYDATYFCDIVDMKSSPVKLENDSGVACYWEFVADGKSAYWGGTIIPKLVNLKFRKKDG